MADKAIGILFEVAGKGDVAGESGKRINGQLRQIVGHINKNDPLKLKIQIDQKHVEKQVKDLQKQLQDISGDSSKKSSESSGKKSISSEYSAARKIMKDYYATKLKYERAQSKSKKVDDSLVSQWDDAKKAFNEYFDLTKETIGDQQNDVLKLKESINGLTDEQREAINNLLRAQELQSKTNASTVTTNAQQAWSNLTAKVHDYISRVEYAASRDDKAAEGLRELRNLANSTDYRGYDELKKKLAEVQHYINECGLAAETWGQRMVKTFGSKVRSAIAAIVVAKASQYIKEVYDNVVDLDEAVVNLQIATGKTREETKQLVKEYANLAKQLGATTKDIAGSADTWLRQGYSEEDSEELIKNSTMLSKLGQMEAEEASKALTSAMNGYKVSVENSIKIVDKFAAVDMEAAASAGDIATAMAETATSADTAGVSMDKLIGYITVVKEVTQDGAESVGTFYKTLFARMNNVAAGNFVDDETGESLNDVETVLNKLGIALRDSQDEFRNSGDVLDDIADRWDNFTTVEKHAIATAMAGTRQQEKFIVLMENYGDAIDYTNTAMNSAGVAGEKYNAWLDGIDGRVNALKSSFEALSMTLLDSELIIDMVDLLNKILTIITAVVDKIGGLNTILYATVSLIAIMKADSIIAFFGSLSKLKTLLPALITNTKTFVSTLITTKATGTSMGSSVSAAFNSVGVAATSAQVAVGAFAAVLGIALIAINSYNSAVQERINNALSSADATHAEGQKHLENAKTIEELIQEYENLHKANDGVFSGEAADRVRSIQESITNLVGEQASNIDLVNGKLDEEIKKMKELASGALVDDAIKKGQDSIAEANNAYKSKVGAWNASAHVILGETYTEYLWGLYSSGGLSQFTEEWTDKFGVEIQGEDLPSGIGTDITQYVLRSEFDTIEEFVKQYESIAALKSELAGSYGETELYKAASGYVSEYKDIYERYQSGKLLIEDAEKLRAELEAELDDDSGSTTDKTNYLSQDDLEKEKEWYETQIDQFENLIDLRKELLKTYQEELEYQNELEKKQKKVADLQTKLAVAQLDDSAAGQARARQLEADLLESQEDLDDFTLDHAIDVLTNHLDSANEEWKTIIQGRLDKIANLLERIENGESITIATSGLGELNVYKYHTGGFVGGHAYLGSNEEFAKLLEGEFVSTPAQMQKFMEKTLPQIANYETSSSKNEFNAPLIEISCGSVTNESIPKLEQIVSDAVQEIKKQLDSGLSRTGFKKSSAMRLQ